LLFIGQVTSRTGDIVFQVALADFALIHHRPALLAWSLLGQAAGAVSMLLLGGALADRFGARRMMLAADTARAGAVAAIAILAGSGCTAILPLVGCAALLGLGDGTFEPAFTVAFMELLPGDELLAANSMQSLAMRFAFMGGAAFGSLLVSVGSAGTALAYDALTFAASLGFLMAAGRWPRTAPKDHDRLFAAVAAGARYVSGQRWLWTSIASFGVTVALVLTPAKVLLPLVVERRLGGGGGTYGLLLAGQGAGALLAGLLVGGRTRLARPGAVVFGTIIAANLAFLLLAVSRWPAISVGASMIAGGGIAVATIAWAAQLQRRVPGALLGRVSAFDWLVSLGAAPAALALTPWLLHSWSATALLVGASAIGVLASAGTLLVRDVRAASTWQHRVDAEPGFANG